MSVHHEARRGFSQGAEAYERGRPAYPPEAVRWLVQQLALRRDRVAVDVGAGTGKLTRALLPSGARVIAVEPVAEMRSVLERNVPGVELLGGTAEELPLGGGTVDAVVSAQAFHWFDGPRASAEFHRVLRPGGRLGLIWNSRDRQQQLHHAISEIIEPHRRGTPSYYSDHWRRAFEHTSLFALTDEVRIRFEQVLDVEQFVDRVMSISFVAALDERQRATVLSRLQELAHDRLEPLSYWSEVFVYGRI